jgi:hypothetical protein
LNVSIRIASPGADGAVTQSNVAVAVGSGTGAHTGTSPTTVPQPAPSAIPGVLLPLPDIPAIVAAVSAPVTVALSPSITVTAPLIEHGVEALPVLVGAPASIDEQLDVPFVPAMVGTPLVALPSRFSPDPLAAGRAGGVPPADARAAVGAVGTHAELGALTSGEASGRAGATSPDHRRGRDAQRPRWHAPAPRPAPESAPSATSAAPATGGGSSSGGIPIFLALPFLAAMLDLARRVVLDGTALPSGHRSRMPDDPG